MEILLIVFMLGAVALVGYLIISALSAPAAREEFRIGLVADRQRAIQELQDTDDIEDIFVSFAITSGSIAFDWKRKLIYLGRQRTEHYPLPPTFRAIPFSELRGAEVVIEQKSSTQSNSQIQTNRGSQLAGAAVGGLIAGPAGMIVGGLSANATVSGSSITNERVAKVQLLVHLVD